MQCTPDDLSLDPESLSQNRDAVVRICIPGAPTGRDERHTGKPADWLAGATQPRCGNKTLLNKVEGEN